MIFNSLDFAIFFPIVFLLYWFVFDKTIRLQNFFILAASYFFYAWWDWRFLSLILLSSITDFIVAQKMEEATSDKKRKAFLMVSLLFNLGMLAYFKYSNFFIENFNQGFTLLGSEFQIDRLNLLLPIGISFYTFQTIGYTIDVYRKEFKAVRDPLTFFVFVSFFPQLVAGPIERARRFIPQLRKARKFDEELAKDGLRQIMWGLFLKCFIADTAALFVGRIVSNYLILSGGTLFLGTMYFGIQVYADFAGYSAIAIGLSKLMGFDLKNNFSFPFTSTSSAEFWRRWHISLMTWFRDYVYRSLGGRKKGFFIGIRNIMIIFIASGLWHGAAWNFVLWGFVTGLTLVYEMIRQQYKLPHIFSFNFISHSVVRNILASAVITLIAMAVSGIFAMPDLQTAFAYYSKIFSPSILHFSRIQSYYLIVVVLLIAYEHWMKHRKSRHGLDISNLPAYVRYPIYSLSFILFLYSFNIGQQFIYFQF